MQTSANPGYGSELTFKLARCERQFIAHRHETLQRTAVNRAATFRPRHDHLVADLVEDLTVTIHDSEGKQTKGAIEKPV